MKVNRFGEVICEDCHGTGTASEEVFIPCNSCKGVGTFQWIEAILGYEKGSKEYREKKVRRFCELGLRKAERRKDERKNG